MASRFIDAATKAKELGITESVLRSEVLSGELRCYAYLAGDHAEATHERFAPPWSEEEFPSVEWDDHGCSLHRHGNWSGRDTNGRLFEKLPYSLPRYTVSGWVVLSRGVYEELLTGKSVNLHQRWIWIEPIRRSGLSPAGPRQIDVYS